MSSASGKQDGGWQEQGEEVVQGHPGAPAMMVCLLCSTARLSVTPSVPSSPFLSSPPLLSISSALLLLRALYPTLAEKEGGWRPGQRALPGHGIHLGLGLRYGHMGPHLWKSDCIAIHIIVLRVPRAGTLRSCFWTISSNGSATQRCSLQG